MENMTDQTLSPFKIYVEFEEWSKEAWKISFV